MPFMQRGPNEIAFYVGGELNRHVVKDGDTVTLRTGPDQSVIVRNVRILGPNNYAGVIGGFEPGPRSEYNGLSEGQTIEFDESNVFGFGE